MELPATMLDEMRRQTEDLIRHYGEVNRRVGQVGLDGVPGLLATTHQIEQALATIGSQEMDWMIGEVRRLLEQLVHMDAQVQRVRELKLHLERGTALELPDRRARDL